jgi:hypothetical protein
MPSVNMTAHSASAFPVEAVEPLAFEASLRAQAT